MIAAVLAADTAGLINEAIEELKSNIRGLFAGSGIERFAAALREAVSLFSMTTEIGRKF